MNDEAIKSLIAQAESAALAHDIPGLIHVYRELSQLGVVQASARIGELYELGFQYKTYLFERNWCEALIWYRRAVAECDDPLAHLGLGRIYYEGSSSVAKDLVMAREHFRAAFKKNMPMAGIYLGYMSLSGVGTEKNLQEAEGFFKEAAKGGIAVAYRYLAIIAASSGRFFRMISLLLQGVATYCKQKLRDRKDLNMWIKDRDHSLSS